MPSTRCEKCHAVCGQRRICVVCGKRICSYCASDWKKLKRKACIGLCARTAYARLKNHVVVVRTVWGALPLRVSTDVTA